uniref:Uncharacterized protein n=1 Tax=Cacopsylla melanoneura TaxID=428564 RepID=A0A8D9EBZ2_9HEMI
MASFLTDNWTHPCGPREGKVKCSLVYGGTVVSTCIAQKPKPRHPPRREPLTMCFKSSTRSDVRTSWAVTSSGKVPRAGLHELISPPPPLLPPPPTRVSALITLPSP